MSHNPLVNFGLFAFLGLVIMLIGLRTNPKLKRVLETLGAVIFHIGVFGILYEKVSIILFISLVAFVLSLFVLIDPLKFANFIPIRPFRACGLFLLFVAIAFSTLYITNYPLWLWVVPLVIYFLPYLIPALKPRLASLHFLAWMIVLINMTFISYAMYSHLYPEKSIHPLIGWFDTTTQNAAPVDAKSDLFAMPEKPVPVVLPTPVGALREAPTPQTPPRAIPFGDKFHESPLQETPPTSLLQDGPFLKSLHDADEKFLRLQKDFENLKRENEELKAENARLKSGQ